MRLTLACPFFFGAAISASALARAVIWSLPGSATTTRSGEIEIVMLRTQRLRHRKSFAEDGEFRQSRLKAHSMMFRDQWPGCPIEGDNRLWRRQCTSRKVDWST